MSLTSMKIGFVGAGIVALAGTVGSVASWAWAEGPHAHPQAAGASGAQPAPGVMSMAFPTGDRSTSALLIESQGPSQTPVGRPYPYSIKVTNITKNLVLEHVAIRQSIAPGFAIEKAEPEATKGDGQVSWSIPKLAPGESATIRATALGEKEGDASSCIRASYEPSLCVTTKFIRQEIQVTKEAPESADLCDIIPIRYVVKNAGSGPARDVKLTDELPKGLVTAEGKSSVEANVGELGPGQAKELTVNASAERPGTYTSRAMARGADDLHAQSNQTSTAIRQSKLAVQIVGPDAQYVNEAITYKVTVKNEGDSPARDAKLQVQADPNAPVRRVSKTGPDAAAPQVNGQALAWNLGTLEPGKTSDVSFTVVARGKAELKQAAVATSACARGGDAARATASSQTEILTFPALLLEMVDQADPIKVGTDEVYTIVVFNQGEGDDHNVKIVCKLPEGFTYVKSDGPTKGTANGQDVSFEPVPVLKPKEKMTWTVQAKAVKVGDVRTVVELTSDYLVKPVPETEPTRLVD